VRSVAYILVAVFIVSLVAFATSPADTLDDNPEVLSLYARGKRLLREGNYLDAARVFEELAGRFSNSSNMDLFVFNRAKAEYYFGDYDKALAGFAGFVNRFPNSPLLPYARFFLGNINYLGGNVTQAFRDYIDAYAGSTDTRLDGLVEQAVGATVADAREVSLGLADFDRLKGAKRCTLIRVVADKLVSRDDLTTANRLLRACGEQSESAGTSAAGYKGQLRVAVVLPLSGDLQSFGKEIYNGAVIAADMYRGSSGKDIDVQPFDSKGDPINAARIVRELSDSPYDVVVGPLTSEESSVASATLSCGDLPLVAPAATQAGLTLLSETSFQLSPNIELQGTQMAWYAFNNLHADSAAIITSTTPDDVLMSQAFANRFRQLGGTVVAIEYYRQRDQDFGAYIRDIKAMLLGLQEDSTFFINDRGDTLDPDGIPARLDCMFIPGRAQQLRQLLPQINFYNLQATYLGSDGWGDESVYKLGDQITKNAVFPSPFLQTGTSDEYVKFSAAYDSRYGERPQRLSALGYDAVHLATLAVDSGGIPRQGLVDQMKKTFNYEGAAGIVTFGEQRENVAMPIYRIDNGRAVMIGVSTVDTEDEPLPSVEPVEEDTTDTGD
jgi:ABC-type branched-subunit amino acid transport system substrate-binding protein